MTRFLFFVAMIMPGLVHAQTQQQLSFCQYVDDFRDIVPAEYVPEDHVVPPDLNSMDMLIVDPVEAFIDVDLAGKFDFGGLAVLEGVEMNASVSEFKIYQDGRIMLNGQDISSQIDQACDEAVVRAADKAEEQARADAEAQEQAEREKPLPSVENDAIESEALEEPSP